MKPLPTQDWPNEIEDPVFFTNRQWAVTGVGMESLDPDYPYDIERFRLMEIHPDPEGDASALLEHVGDKTWVDPDQLIEAFRAALDHHFAGVRLPFDFDRDARALRRARSREEL